MADRYIDESDVHAVMEADVVRAITARAGTSLNRMIELATDLIKGRLRNSGYTLPTFTAPATEVRGVDVTDLTVKLAVLSGVRRALCSLPSSSLELPVDYAATDENQARVGILSGDQILSLPQSTIQSPGGMKFSTATVASGNAQRSSRCMLRGY